MVLNCDPNLQLQWQYYWCGSLCNRIAPQLQCKSQQLQWPQSQWLEPLLHLRPQPQFKTITMVVVSYTKKDNSCIPSFFFKEHITKFQINITIKEAKKQKFTPIFHNINDNNNINNYSKTLIVTQFMKDQKVHNFTII
jgi:hypothetical protein